MYIGLPLIKEYVTLSVQNKLFNHSVWSWIAQKSPGFVTYRNITWTNPKGKLNEINNTVYYKYK